MKRKKKEKKSKDVMGLVEHLSEVRKRLFIVLIAFFVVALVSFNFSDEIVVLLIDTAKELGYELVYLAPGELFAQYIKLSLVSGVAFASPLILYHTWAFIRPGLKKSENTVVFLSLFAGLVCFLMGSVFAFYIVVPLVLNFFINVDPNHTVLATISIQNFLNFIMSTLVTFGIVFEMPVVTVLLSQLGLLKAEWLMKSRRVVIVLLFVIGAFITPPDVVSQVLVSIPMLALFEISIILSKIITKKKIKRENEII
ncbi:MAG: twin-arginine translocase subunit TatC [Eubacteriaceae bacterium]